MADNIVIGAGRLYVAELDADDNPGAERYLGDSVGASLSGGEGDRLTIFAGDGADSSRKLVDKLVDVSRSMSLTLHDLSFDNIALFVMGDVKASGAAAAVASNAPEQFPACKAGDEFQLGTHVSGAPAIGYRTIEKEDVGFLAADSGDTVVNTDDVLVEPSMAEWLDRGGAEATRRTSSATSGDVSDDSTLPSAPKIVVFLDTARARVLLDQGGGFRLSYTPASSGFDYVESATEPLEGAVRYLEYDPREGAGRDIYMTKASIVPNGEWPLKTRDTEQQLGLTCESLGKVYVGPGGVA